ncbi:type VII secretion-associated serine protease mycosin [Streptomyces sp. NBC_01446]|uniref:type VII secretion-associated serine protease mycosin n=1 Tax=Streptomyces sp. NBC_01446 TaxID=2903870 RepID=UPI0022509B81|nr:type VII secretion-associated serine protease mycosin [Streptomyces sp. NBC_01446]MCX4641781.1 type VII secretion-associated serine protease mycosin [Streptomyces sp. NBC_01446]
MGSRTKQVRRLRLLSALSGVVLAGVAVAPAHAETVRGRQWYLDAMRAEQMWKTSTGKGITVAVVDSGVDRSLPDLRGQVLSGKDYSYYPGDEHSDYDGHGTSMGVLIAGTGAKGSTTGSYGLAPGTKILPVRVPDFIERSRADGDGNPDDFPTYVSKAIRYAADSDAQIINISLGSEEHSKKLDDAVSYALSKNKLIFSAVGNTGSGTNRLEYPSATPGVVGVGAIGKDLKKTNESQHGPQVDLVAPGAEMLHTCTGKTGLCESHGTSDATAIASASAALIWSKHPDWTNNQVLRVLLNTASGPVSGLKRSDSIGYGAVRPRIALANPGDPGPADEYPLPDFKPGASSSASKAPGPDSSKGATAPAAAPDGDGMNPMPWILGGVGALVLAGGAVAALTQRGRRRQKATATQTVPAWQPTPPPQQPYATDWNQQAPPGPPQGGQQWPPYQDTNHTGRP